MATAAAVRTYWIDGQSVAAADARVPALAHGLHYGTSVFEGIRAYPTARGIALFRLDAHLARLYASATHYGMQIPYGHDELARAVVETLRASELRDAYVRPLAFYGDETIALAPREKCSTHVLIAVFGFPPLAAGSAGMRATISPIQKFSSLALPATIKAGGHYTNSVLALQDAVARGFDEAILLNVRGEVAEGTGENLFVVKDGVLATNDASADVLYGITRDSVLAIARDLGIEARIQPLTVTELLAADEAFFTGTAAEVVPILSVDETVFTTHRPITTALRTAYARTVRGEEPRYSSWLTFV